MTVLDAPVSTTVERDALAALAPLFRYPDGALATAITDARCMAALDAFAAEVRDLDLRSIYTATFDLAPTCSPYLGVHLFDEEARERARLMVGLRLAYERQGESFAGELPDHIAEVLAFAPRFEDDEWRDLAALVLLPALLRMEDVLTSTSNPYRHLVAAAAALCRGENS